MKKIQFLVPGFFLLLQLSFSQNVAITDDSTYTADEAAILDVKSDTKGMLFPRLSSSARTSISSPPDGLIVYDTTTSSFWFYKQSAWTEIEGVALWSRDILNNHTYLRNSDDKVGIGISSPTQKLDVNGTVKMTGFQMPAGAASGYVLKSDGSGNGTWGVPFRLRAETWPWLQDQVTLTGGAQINLTQTGNVITIASTATGGDNDWSGAGTGKMYATSLTDKVAIGNSNPTAKLFVTGTQGDKVGILCDCGNGIHIVDPYLNGIEIENPGLSLIDGIVISDPLDDGIEIKKPQGDGIFIQKPGVHGVYVALDSANNTGSAVYAVNKGTKYGVYGMSREVTAQMGSLPAAGVAGESKSNRGVVGRSDSLDGVFGKTNRIHTYGSGPTNIVAGVLGKPADACNDADNFSVAGIPSSYSSTGLLGIGGQRGHGVVGLPGGHAGYTTAGIRGITREGVGWPPPHYPLSPPQALAKEQVGVLGQALDYTGVWGESRTKRGIVGTSGRQLIYAEVSQESSGIYGYSDIGHGVAGRSQLSDSTMAGVKAEGNGTAAPGDLESAALNIHNGAITVTGGERPAGKVNIPGPWGPFTDQYVMGHNHIIGFFTTTIIYNNLITPNSIILLTVEGFDSFAATTPPQMGQVQIWVYYMGYPLTDPPQTVNYLIIDSL